MLTLGSNSDSRDSDGLLVDVSAINSLTTGVAGDNNHTYDFGFSDTPPTVPPVTPPGGGGKITAMGFAPGRVTDLSGLPFTRYESLSDVVLKYRFSN